MRDTSKDETIKRNYIQKYMHLFGEYELVKKKEHSQFRFAKDFYNFYNVDFRSFLKYYKRYQQSGKKSAMLPQKRGPKYKSRRPLPLIENKVMQLREKGLNKYEIVHILKPILKLKTPSCSGMYNIFKRHGLNKLTRPMKQNKRQIIKKSAGELAHLDAHYLSKNLIIDDSKRRYLVAVVDDCTRIVWAELIYDLKSITVMFATLKCFNIIADQYDIRFAEALTDNGSEYGIKTSKKKNEHPFERMLMELGIKHRYTRPYRPQTNGKVERFWRTIEDDLFRETSFESEDNIKQELLEYLVYYNHKRPHQGLDGKTPVEFAENCPRIT